MDASEVTKLRADSCYRHPKKKIIIFLPEVVQVNGSSNWRPDGDSRLIVGAASAVSYVFAIIASEDTGDPFTELVCWPRVCVEGVTAALADATRFQVFAVLVGDLGG